MTGTANPVRTIGVSLLAIPEVDASALAGLHGVLTAFERMLPCGVRFEARIVSPTAVATNHASSGEFITNVLGVPLPVHGRLREVETTDVVIMPSLFLFEHRWPADPYPEITAWLRRQYAQHALICSACTSAFLLAETGLLDEQPATLHWAFEDLFRAHFPRVKLDINRALLQTGGSGRILMSGASAAWHDLLIEVMARFAGPEPAQVISKYFLLSPHADGQAPYRLFHGRRDHGDAMILAAQRWLHDNLNAANPVERVVTVSGAQVRTFSRRFVKATGLTPVRYVQLLRIEHAKRRLETEDVAIDQISWDIGYEDASFFRRLFRRQTGMSPRDYRRRFRVPTLRSQNR